MGTRALEFRKKSLRVRVDTKGPIRVLYKGLGGLGFRVV